MNGKPKRSSKYLQKHMKMYKILMKWIVTFMSEVKSD